MRNYIILLGLIAMLPIAIYANLPTCYFTYSQITSQLYALEAANPDIAKVHIIGYSQQENIPIYAMQISDNVLTQEEEPALLFVGQVHAEEVLGVQITMHNISQILQFREQDPYRQWISQLETWWIPTLNPEGHNVVTSNVDYTYRKNKRDNNNNGIFDFSVLTGFDIDGVDINRNFDYNWVHGDTLMQPPTPSSPEAYDYYRGPAPNSESEVQALIRLADQKKFVYSICWHSSRSGNFAEKVYYSFNWKDVRPSPDLAFAQAIAQGVASQIQKENGGTYEYFPNASRRGAFHDWMYQQFGTIQLLIEVGTRNIQPDSLLMVNTIQRASNGVTWMLNRSLMFSTAVSSTSMLTGNTIDSVSQQPIDAEIIITQRHAPWFRPRISDPDTGRFFKPLPMGSYTVHARRKGYWDKIINSVTVQNAFWTTISVPMVPKDPAIIVGRVHSNQTDIPARILIKDVQNDTLLVDGQFIHHGYEGEYPVEITADGYYPYLGTLSLSAGQNIRSFNLSPATSIFAEDWENGTEQWIADAPWTLQNELSVSGNAITDSWGGRGTYNVNCNVMIQTVNQIHLPSDGNPLLMFDSHLYTEWDYDPVRIEVSIDGTEWQQVWIKSGRHDFWQKEFVDLGQFSGQSVYIRFRLQDSSIAEELTDPGWTIDNINIVTGTATSIEDQVLTPVFYAALYPNFPNPFNPETTIKYSLAKSVPVRIDIFNMKGQRIRSYDNGIQSQGNHSIVWDGTDDGGTKVSSGLFFYRLSAGSYVHTRKMMLMK